jgi:hypothetical protein
MCGKKEEKSGRDIRVCPFYFGWRGELVKQVATDQAKCLQNICMLWNTSEQDCNLNVIAKQLAVVVPPAMK